MNKTEFGYFIIIEGCDGSGKTTIAKALEQKLKENNYDAIYTREPGGSKLGEEIRNIVLHNKMDTVEYTMLFAASMSADVREIINPAIDEKKIVICDRFVRSTYIYQGYHKQKPDEDIYSYLQRYQDFISVEQFACRGISPDIEFILDVPAELAWQRTHERNEEVDVFESEGFKAFEDRANAYLESAGDELYWKDNYYELKHIDATRSIDEVVQECYDFIISMINEDNENTSRPLK